MPSIVGSPVPTASLVLAGILVLALTLGWAALERHLGAAEIAQQLAATPVFVDDAAAAGLDFHFFNGATGELYLVEITGSGGGLIDYDGDGDLDIWGAQGQLLGPTKPEHELAALVNHPLPLTDRLYRNDLEVRADGSRVLRFTDVSEEAGIGPTAYGMGVATGDFDNDGRMDLYRTNFGSNQLLRNNGDGTFVDVTEVSGTDDRRWSSSATFFDFDRDGWLDLFVVNYLAYTIETRTRCLSSTGAPGYCDPQVYPSISDRLFRNRGDGTFEDVSSKSGIALAEWTGLGVVSSDFDDDGWPDLYVANDGQPNQLFMNNRDGTFRDDTLLAGCAVNAEGEREASMGVDAADIDNDGDEEIFLTHLTGQTNTLYLNEGEAMFSDVTRASGLARPSWAFTSFGTRFFDYDNDGWLDLLTVSGAVHFFAGGNEEELHQTNQLFRNLGGVRFEEVTQQAGPIFQSEEVSRGAAFGDLDNDGDTDVVVFNNDGPTRLLINHVGSRNDWLGLRLVGTTVARDMLGARAALIRPGQPTLWRRVRTDGSFASANDPRLLFGLDGVSTKIRLEVYWPSGLAEEFTGLAVNQYSTLQEGTGRPLPQSGGQESVSQEAPGSG